MRRCSLAGTSPRNTSSSVPRLMALCSARTCTLPPGSAGQRPPRSAARPGASVQQAL
ncbi:MAG: hypothetical protein QM777_23590 [Pseudorhodoferax sp.]